ncbi:hypothetical protein N6B72_13840 [Chryseobacterium soli]|uniref:hypothetical protein n=1 Tax=Chryseobacterium soli TaxID=445961 RepID=UPI002954852C|nr:hypothetical protein [Chryseobacterium soli]MDV7698003.1 hypothetical protein [Chryseobacterium soli]
MKRIGISDPHTMDEAVKNICNDELLQNSFFESIHNVSGGLDKQQYLSMGMKNTNVEKLIEYSNIILSIKREKEWKLNKLNELKEIQNKISNNELFLFHELVNRPELMVVDSSNLQKDIESIISVMSLEFGNEKPFDLVYPLLFEVNSFGKIVGVFNKKNNESKEINLKSFLLNEKGFVINKKQKINIPFYYPFKISIKSSSNYKKINVKVKKNKENILIEQIDVSRYASSPAGKIFFEKEKSISAVYFEELKKYLLSEKSQKIIKSTEYKTFKIDRNVMYISFIVGENEIIRNLENTTFNINEIID